MTGVYFCGPSLCQQCTYCTWLKCYWGMCTLAFTVTFPQCIISTMHMLYLALVLLGNMHIGLHCNYWRTYTFWTWRGEIMSMSKESWGNRQILHFKRPQSMQYSQKWRNTMIVAILHNIVTLPFPEGGRKWKQMKWDFDFSQLSPQNVIETACDLPFARVHVAMMSKNMKQWEWCFLYFLRSTGDHVIWMWYFLLFSPLHQTSPGIPASDDHVPGIPNNKISHFQTWH